MPPSVARPRARPEQAPLRRGRRADQPGEVWAELTLCSLIVAIIGPGLTLLLVGSAATAIAIGLTTGVLVAAAGLSWATVAARHGLGPGPWPLLATGGALATLVVGAASAAAGHPARGVATTLAAAALTSWSIVATIRAELRRRALRRLATCLATDLGIRTAIDPVELVRMRAWRAWRGLRPRAGHILPPTGTSLSSPEVLEAIRSTFDTRFGIYVYLSPDPRHDRISFRAGDRPHTDPEDPRLTRLRQVAESLGKALPEPSVTIDRWADEAPEAKPSALEVFGVAAFTVRHGPTPALGNPGTRAIICAELGRMLYGDPHCLAARWSGHSDTVHFHVRPELPTVTPNPVLDLAEIKTRFGGQIVLPLAVDEYGEMLGWQLTDTTQPHALIVGPTGGGKTVAILGLALAAARIGIEVRGVDPKYIELRGLRGWPNVTALATGRSVPEMVAVIDDTHAEMHRRYDLIDRGQADEDDVHKILLILDEFYVFVEQVNTWWKAHKPRGERRNTHPVIDKVGEMAAMARGAGIHVLLGVQRPDSSLFPAGARDNFRFRVALSELSSEGNRMMFARDARELPRIPANTPGRAIVSATYGPRLAQVYWTPNPAQYHALSPDDQRLIHVLVPPGHQWTGPQRPTSVALPAAEREPSVLDRFLALVNFALRTHHAHLAGAATGGPPTGPDRLGRWGWISDVGGHPRPGGTLIGFLDTESHEDGEARLYLLPQQALQAATHMAQATGTPLPTSRTAIDAALGDLVATETDNGRPRRTVRRNLPGLGRIRIWDLNAAVLTDAATDPAHLAQQEQAAGR